MSEENKEIADQFTNELTNIHGLMRKDKTNILVSLTTVEKEGKYIIEYNIEAAWCPDTKEESNREIPSYMG